MDDRAGPWLRGANLGDQETLRLWRNAHAHRFFHQQPVTPECQRRWFEGYLGRPDDFLFMVVAGEETVGCIGIRFRDGGWDVYNVIRGRASRDSAGFMSLALAAVIEFARGRRPAAVRADVLPDNPALAWYLRNGFITVADDERSVRLLYRGKVGEEWVTSR
jgi:hypothetical protein